jgi:hypothetical protein
MNIQEDKTKVIKLYYKEIVQGVKILPGVTIQEFKDFIYVVLDIPKSRKIQIYDSQRNAVIFGTGIPDEIELHIETKNSYQDQSDDDSCYSN